LRSFLHDFRVPADTGLDAMRDEILQLLEDEDDVPVEILRRAAAPGARLTVADERGLCSELLVKVARAGAIVAATAHGRLAPGDRVSARVFDGEHVRRLTFAIDEVEETRDGRDDVLARLVECTDALDERDAERFPFDAGGTAIAAETFSPSLDPRATAIRIAQVSPGGLAFYADRRYEPGESLDVAFEDEGGALLRCRVHVLRAERAVYGRRHYAARITAIGEIDAVRLERICSRARLRAAAEAEAAAAEPPLRDLIVASARGGGLLRRFRRA
jgi:hypothetical protein